MFGDPGAQARHVANIGNERVGMRANEGQSPKDGLAGDVVPGTSLAIAQAAVLGVGGDDQVFGAVAARRRVPKDHLERYRKGKR